MNWYTLELQGEKEDKILDLLKDQLEHVTLETN